MSAPTPVPSITASYKPYTWPRNWPPTPAPAPPAWTDFTAYVSRVIPGACVLVVVLLVLPKRLVELRLVTYILLFVLFRDAMTPMGLWSVSENVVIRFPDSPSIHIMLGTLSGAFAYAITLLEPDWTAYLAWFRPGGKTTSIMFGALYSLLIVLPCWLYYSMSGAVAPNVVAGKSFFSLMSLMFLSYCGNLLEEVLFRGFLQGHLERSLILNHSDDVVSARRRAAALSALLFGAFHVGLASTVTTVGAPLLIFTIYEGAICAYLRLHFGLLSASVAHALAVFWLACGMLPRRASQYE